MRRLALLGVAVGLAGCGTQSEFTTLDKELQRTAGTLQPSSVIFRRLADNPPDYRSPQQYDAPFTPGYNPRGETAPLNTISGVVENITRDWEDLKDILSVQGDESEELYDYPAIGRIADRLAMRGRELKKAREYELIAAGVSSDEFQPAVLDENIKVFNVNAHKLQLAVHQHKPDELEEVIANMPRATPDFFRSTEEQ